MGQSYVDYSKDASMDELSGLIMEASIELLQKLDVGEEFLSELEVDKPPESFSNTGTPNRVIAAIRGLLVKLQREANLTDENGMIVLKTEDMRLTHGIGLVRMLIETRKEKPNIVIKCRDDVRSCTLNFVGEAAERAALVGFKVKDAAVATRVLSTGMRARTFAVGEKLSPEFSIWDYMSDEIVIPHSGMIGVVLPIYDERLLREAGIPYRVLPDPQRCPAVFMQRFLNAKAAQKVFRQRK